MKAKILSVDPRWIATLWNNANRVERDGGSMLFLLPTGDGIPDDVRVISVCNDWQTNRIQILVEHDSFPDVVPGERPEIVVMNETRVVELFQKPQPGWGAIAKRIQ